MSRILDGTLYIAYEFNHRQHAKSYNKITGEYARCESVGNYFLHTSLRRFNTKGYGYCKWRKATNEEVEEFKRWLQNNGKTEEV